MSELDNILSKLELGLAETGNVIVFKDFTPPFTKLTDACVDYLKYVGYSVHKPLVYSRKIKSLDELINLFYGLLKNHGYSSPYRDETIERNIASEFVEGRQEADGLSKEAALSQCGELIQIVFSNLDRFNFNRTLNFRMFGQGKMGWVTNLAVEIMNEMQQNIQDAVSERIIAKYMLELENEPASLLTEEEIDEKLRLIEEEENINGKKEN